MRKEVAFLLLAAIVLLPALAETKVEEAPEIQTFGNFSVRIFISTTLSFNDSATGFNWTLVRPGLVNSTSANYLNVTVDAITNTVTDIYFKSTTLSSGGDTIDVPSNLVMDEVITMNSRPVVVQNNYPGSANQGYWENVPKPVGSPQQRLLYAFLTVPNGTLAGSYSGTFTLKIVGNGVVP